MYLRLVGSRMRVTSNSARISCSSGGGLCCSRATNSFNFNKVVRRQFSWDTIPQLVENGILQYHAFSGFPWWLTIASSTVAVRVALFPLIRLNILHTSEFVRVVPYLRLLKSLLIGRMLQLKANPTANPYPVLKAYLRGIWASVRHTKIKFGKFFMYPILNMAVFITFVLGIRRLVFSEKASDMEEGGILCFKNLTKKDPTYVMPLTAFSLTYLTLFLTFRRMQGQTKSQFIANFRDFFSSSSILLLPMYSYQPAAIFCYWIPSSALAAVQSAILGNQRARAILRLPQAAELAKAAGKKSNIRPAFDPVYFTLHAPKSHLKFRPKHLPVTNLHLY
jgi:YidC/Oxa1 family membrane protein insertase